jgi:hypothetical protein
MAPYDGGQRNQATAINALLLIFFVSTALFPSSGEQFQYGRIYFPEFIFVVNAAKRLCLFLVSPFKFSLTLVSH